VQARQDLSELSRASQTASHVVSYGLPGLLGCTMVAQNIFMRQVVSHGQSAAQGYRLYSRGAMMAESMTDPDPSELFYEIPIRERLGPVLRELEKRLAGNANALVYGLASHPPDFDILYISPTAMRECTGMERLPQMSARVSWKRLRKSSLRQVFPKRLASAAGSK